MSSVSVTVPNLGESITEAIVGRFLKQPGDSVAADEAVAELDTDKVSVEVFSPVNGVIEELKAAEGDTLSVGDVVVVITEGAAPEPKKAANGSGAVPEADGQDAEETTVVQPAEPVAKPVAKAVVRPGDKVEPPSVRRRRRQGGAPVTVKIGDDDSGPLAEGEEAVPMTPIRKRIAERLVQAQTEAAILTTFNEVDMTEVMALRARHKEEFLKRYGVKLGFMSFFIKAAVESLRDFPGINAEIRGDKIVYKKHYHIGVAIGSGKGLVVPVIRDCDILSFAEIEQAIVDYVEKAQTNKLKLEDLQGGTFTISNGGVFGSMLSTPLLNYPQTGILGMHNIVKRPVAVGDEVQVRPVMYLALSYDHRLVDGREAVRFLVGIKERIESPARLLFEL